MNKLYSNSLMIKNQDLQIDQVQQNSNIRVKIKIIIKCITKNKEINLAYKMSQKMNRAFNMKMETMKFKIKIYFIRNSSRMIFFNSNKKREEYQNKNIKDIKVKLQ